MQEQHEETIHKAYNAFNSRNIEEALLVMHAQVHWPKAWEGGHIVGHDEIKSYWTRQWSEINPTVKPIGFRERPDDGLEVSVHQSVKDLEGKPVFDGIVKHIYTFENGLIKRMDIEI
ncbi:ketosteroid isomerase [Flavobacterium sp. Sd200]|uniref:nuclear transport factor 2 family protein n=1 Tax=Flavobacterium sp. Sd200 TaxID=2692211 RepID=UPI0013720DC9|nr:nuclear transport factor 2 family protein [Flavobacterium sp. Sd200]MXN91181.1 ketosteroid isomerase [Flavobacterium sp. Sd200]